MEGVERARGEEPGVEEVEFQRVCGEKTVLCLVARRGGVGEHLGIDKSCGVVLLLEVGFCKIVVVAGLEPEHARNVAHPLPVAVRLHPVLEVNGCGVVLRGEGGCCRSGEGLGHDAVALHLGGCRWLRKGGEGDCPEAAEEDGNGQTHNSMRNEE